jgi:very-short-patch-repair endonuclease
MTNDLSLCESPIELMLGQALLRWLDIEPQFAVCIHGKRYRIDFAVIVPGDDSLKIAVECDGHSFHERTKEQAQRDRSRDRALVADGWKVMRFTGREITKDALRCAEEVFRVFFDHGWNAGKRAFDAWLAADTSGLPPSKPGTIEALIDVEAFLAKDGSAEEKAKCIERLGPVLAEVRGAIEGRLYLERIVKRFGFQAGRVPDEAP